MICYKSWAKLFLALALAGAWNTSSQECVAQWARYTPSTPTISPYLNLTRFNNGGLPNYYALVRPQIHQQQVNLQNRTLLRTQENQIIQLENEVQQGLVAPSATGSGSWFMVPGKQTSFMNTSQFYPEPIRGRGRR